MEEVESEWLGKYTALQESAAAQQRQHRDHIADLKVQCEERLEEVRGRGFRILSLAFSPSLSLPFLRLALLTLTLTLPCLPLP